MINHPTVIYRAKFKNIEATELAKQKIIEEERKKYAVHKCYVVVIKVCTCRKKEDTSFVGANMAANYTHQSLRCKSYMKPK